MPDIFIKNVKCNKHLATVGVFGWTGWTVWAEACDTVIDAQEVSVQSSNSIRLSAFLFLKVWQNIFVS